jgi:hypothetical protein
MGAEVRLWWLKTYSAFSDRHNFAKLLMYLASGDRYSDTQTGLETWA